MEIIEAWAEGAKAGDTLPFKDVFKALGASGDVFRKEVRCHPEFVGAIAELGVTEWGRGRYFTGFILAH